MTDEFKVGDDVFANGVPVTILQLGENNASVMTNYGPMVVGIENITKEKP